MDAERLHLFSRDRTDPVEAAHLQVLDEGCAKLGRDDEQPVRPAVVRGQLGQELVVGNTGGCGQPCLRPNAGPDVPGDLGHRSDALQVFCDVEICLVQRQWLDDRGMLGTNLPYLERDGLVDVEAGPDEHELGTPTAGGDARHGRADAEPPRLVACRRYHTAFARPANGDGLAAERRVIPLLHRRVEGVHVDVDDLTRGSRGSVRVLQGAACLFRHARRIPRARQLDTASDGFMGVGCRLSNLAQSLGQSSERHRCLAPAKWRCPQGSPPFGGPRPGSPGRCVEVVGFGPDPVTKQASSGSDRRSSGESSDRAISASV